MKKPKYFYYITHKDNLKSILQKGILSRNQMNKNLLVRIGFKEIKSIHAEDIIQIRKNKKFKNRSLWEYTNLYFEVRNPMLYRVIDTFKKENIVVLQINPDIINKENIGITNGNAASSETEFFENIEKGLSSLDLNQFQKEYWNDSDKRKLMAELLVPDSVSPEKIMGIYVANDKIATQIRQEQKTGGLNVIPHPKMFFQPEYQNQISNNIVLKKGDMFFSESQTFTISVNIVGVMGKGLASRAKYQFPDVYVLYQDICRQKKLKMGVPYLYKRENNFEKSLLEDTKTITSENGNRWFLFFPTKNHWREKSPLEGIERGLNWLVESYKNLGIKSIALPALGCGLGGLAWKDVGPLMCQYLTQTDLQSSIYLPLERSIPPEQLKLEFLLKKNK